MEKIDRVFIPHRIMFFLRLKVMFLAFTALIGGLLLYALFRNSDVLAYKILGKPIFLNGLYRTVPQKNYFYDFVVYSLPDGLWLLSGVLFIRCLWLEDTMTSSIYIFVICLCALVLEMCQMFHLFPGTFDILDLCAMALAVFGESVFYTNIFVRRIRYAYQF